MGFSPISKLFLILLNYSLKALKDSAIYKQSILMQYYIYFISDLGIFVQMILDKCCIINK